MAVPAHDQRDFDFARQYKLPIEVVIDDPKSPLDPATMIETRRDQLRLLLTRSWRSADHAIALGREEINSLMAAVRTLSPQATLDRGYAVVQDEQGAIVRSATDLASGDRLKLLLASGSAPVIVE